MILKMLSVFDIKVGAYLPPMFFRSRLEAIRAFTSACSDPKHDFAKYAEDYTLFELGEWDDSSSKTNCHLTPIPLVKAIECLSENINISSLPGLNKAVNDSIN